MADNWISAEKYFNETFIPLQGAWGPFCAFCHLIKFSVHIIICFPVNVAQMYSAAQRILLQLRFINTVVCAQRLLTDSRLGVLSACAWVSVGVGNDPLHHSGRSSTCSHTRSPVSTYWLADLYWIATYHMLNGVLIIKSVYEISTYPQGLSCMANEFWHTSSFIC